MTFKRWLLPSFILFTVGMIVGLVAQGPLASYLAENLSGLKQLAGTLSPFQVSTAVYIFFKNILALALSFVLSPLLLVFPVMVLTVNGALLSFVTAAGLAHASPGLILAAILPHGIIELPAIIIGEAAALHLGAASLAALAIPSRREHFLADLIQDLKVLALSSLLLVPAALMETFITPLLVT